MYTLCTCGMPWWAWLILGLVLIALGRKSTQYPQILKAAGLACVVIGVIGLIGMIILRILL